MAWDEWEQLKSQAERQSAGMRLNQLEANGGLSSGSSSGKYGDLKVSQGDLAKIGEHAFDLHGKLWDKGRSALSSSDKAAGDLSKQGFALGGGLQHVSTRWEEQLTSLRDACAHISNHMTVSKKIHSGDDHYIGRKLSSIDTLDAGFDERVGQPGPKNPVYGEASKHGKKDD
ncbi:hypothetical protein [Streptomyces ipomoeae]|uniref:AG1 protein n=1 Tax=Streptomyces ipomoeae 91-03 TaxID=698759 RepID=L1KZ92_9ACTN|nr:hypothetical protein [Streptomyces ipomoeae]EKX65770.1 hypothetical protein STRIP9103_03815 [Streptomyces ipomoeae 91-03]MDX2694026.1 hypothetical protein [Streptomyces ipomoeae]MDX2840417.1 hypothetical protein [Streptomyces ipomoeae]TQE31253.1 hypothetical protein Sipo7851_25865 [Streptomyces ipomoeae]